jgi:hypothetical protein
MSGSFNVNFNFSHLVFPRRLLNIFPTETHVKTVFHKYYSTTKPPEDHDSKTLDLCSSGSFHVNFTFSEAVVPVKIFKYCPLQTYDCKKFSPPPLGHAFNKNKDVFKLFNSFFLIQNVKQKCWRSLLNNTYFKKSVQTINKKKLVQVFLEMSG